MHARISMIEFELIKFESVSRIRERRTWGKCNLLSDFHSDDRREDQSDRVNNAPLFTQERERKRRGFRFRLGVKSAFVYRT